MEETMEKRKRNNKYWKVIMVTFGDVIFDLLMKDIKIKKVAEYHQQMVIILHILKI